jgi:hypothetical protein
VTLIKNILHHPFPVCCAIAQKEKKSEQKLKIKSEEKLSYP